MDVDDGPKTKDGDLSQYNLDDYDKDTPNDGAPNLPQAFLWSNGAQASVILAISTT